MRRVSTFGVCVCVFFFFGGGGREGPRIFISGFTRVGGRQHAALSLDGLPRLLCGIL